MSKETLILNQPELDVYFCQEIGYFRFFWKITPNTDRAFEVLQEAVLLIFSEAKKYKIDTILVLVDNTSPKMDAKKLMNYKFLKKFEKIYVPHQNFVMCQLMDNELSLSMSVFLEKMYKEGVYFFTNRQEAVFFLKKTANEMKYQAPADVETLEEELLNFNENTVSDYDTRFELLSQRNRLNSLNKLFDLGQLDPDIFLRHKNQITNWFLKFKQTEI